jgi:sugar phosphate isomerase/epimerase
MSFDILPRFGLSSAMGDPSAMQQLSMSEITTYRWSFEQDVENFQDSGYKSISVWLQKLTDYGEEKGIDLLAASSLQVSSVLWAGGFTGSDGRSFCESVKETICALRLSAAVEAGCLVIYTGGRNNHTLRHANRLVRTALDELLPIAEVVEVPLAIEPIHPACATEWTFLTDLEQTLDLVEQYDTPYLKMVCDTYHFSLQQYEPSLLARLVPQLALIHLADRHVAPSIDQERCPLGTGKLPLEQMVATTMEAGYEGDFDVKLMGGEIEPASYWTILEQSQLAFAQFMSACPQFS